MALRNPRNLTLETALAEAEQRYSAANPASRSCHEAACTHLPGGNTRSNFLGS